MKIAFLTNYYNYHQAEFSKFMSVETNNNFFFITTSQMDEDRIKMGWNNGILPDFVIDYKSDSEKCDQIINSADVVIIGSAPRRLIKERLKRKKVTLFYSERIDKRKSSFLKILKELPLFYYYFGRYSNYYCLCASAFTSYDFSKRNCFKEKCYKWGYFPQNVDFNPNNRLNKTMHEKCELLFCSRLIELKHPEFAIMVAKHLKEEGISFNLNILGSGDLDYDISKQISDLGLSDEVHLIGAVPPETVREYMLNSDIFLFTSDRREGWGAVLNESMSNACAVVASSEIGSVPFLLKDGVNGYIYQDGNFQDFYCKVKELCLDQDKRKELSEAAFNTILNTWNAEVGVKRMMELFDDLIKYGESNRYKDGPCSKAEIIKDGWYNN